MIRLDIREKTLSCEDSETGYLGLLRDLLHWRFKKKEQTLTCQ